MEHNRSKQEEYTVKILNKLQQLFDNEDAEAIAVNELEDNANAADFFHALGNLAPTVVYNKLTQRDAGALDFNYIANRLCFQNCLVKTEVPATES